MTNEVDSPLPSAIAIVGFAGRFPGAATVDRFWENIRDGVESISFFSEAELRAAGVDERALSNPRFVPARGVVDEADRFDAAFFGFNPREAEILDPQHRLFLECSWESLEHAGYDPERYRGAIGVYAGVGANAYLVQILASASADDLASGYQLLTGNEKDFFASRVSYKLGLRGPSISVQTACSTSLVAVHIACQSLLMYQCDMALAGGASVGLPQHRGYVYQEGMVVSPDGHCRAFDRQAAGTIGGDGVAVVVLKRLAEALDDGDQIYAVIRSTAVNNDGALKAGYTAPSIDGQAEVIATAHALAEIDPNTITYVEAHGTGTPLGDPIEVAALTKAFRRGTSAKGFCAIGSLKTNVGHLDAAAGVASLIKTTLALHHRQLPASLHFTEANPQIDFAGSPFFVNRSLTPWEAVDTPLRAGVSSFGIGGTNAHTVVEQAPVRDGPGPSRSDQLLVISARTPETLERATANLAAHLKSTPDVNLADVAYTLQTGRKSFMQRRTVVCDSTADAVRALEAPHSKRVRTTHTEQAHRTVAFMFPGQGAQSVDMGRGLYDTEPVFREHLSECAGALQPHLGFDLREVLYPSEDRRAGAAEQLNRTAVTQPALFTIEYALARLWMSWGVQPDAMIGHSLGEYVAACLAGVFTLDDALRLVATRGRLMQQLPAGAMLAVPFAPDALDEFLSDDVSLAAVNAPGASVLSGPTAAIEAVERTLGERGTPGRRLATSHAFHSGMMEPILKPFEAEVRSIPLKAPKMRYISHVTGRWITDAQATDPQYWVHHLRGTVRFADGIALLAHDGDRILLEVGPGHTLVSLARRQVGQATPTLASLKHPDEAESDLQVLLNALGHLWRSGAPIDWVSFVAEERRLRVPLPTYPFERQRYWIAPVPRSVVDVPLQPTAKKPDIGDWFYLPSWRQSAPPELLPQDNSDPSTTRWLMFSDDAGLTPLVAERLATRGHTIVTVVAGERFDRISDDTFVINPAARGDYGELLRTLGAGSALPDRIVHLSCITPRHRHLPERARIDHARQRGVYSLLYLAQALAHHAVGRTARIDVITNATQAVTGEEALCPEWAVVGGLLKVVPQEYPHLACRHIDVAMAGSNASDWELVDRVVQELQTVSSDVTVAYRNGRRWVQRFEPVRLNDPAARPPRLRPAGAYLITGGLGKIGLTLAEYLAATFQARLTLVARSPLPDRSMWNGWLAAHGEDDKTSRTIRRVEQLEAHGAEVLVVSADVARPDEIGRAVDMARERFGRLHGVFHLAGMGLAVPIPEATETLSERQLVPKIDGLCALTAALAGSQLDVAVVTSSLSSILGGLGLAAYAAGNAFVDAYAQQAAGAGEIKWTSVNWDGWDVVESGIKASTGVGALALTPQEGVEAWKRVLSLEGVPQIIVSTGDLHRRMETWTQPRPSMRAAPGGGHRSLHARPALGADYVAPRNDVERDVAAIWEDVLGIASIGMHDGFFDLGGHSLLATQVVSKIRQKYCIELPFRHLFEASTVAEIADYLNAMILAVEVGASRPDADAADREEIQL